MYDFKDSNSDNRCEKYSFSADAVKQFLNELKAKRPQKHYKSLIPNITIIIKCNIVKMLIDDLNDE